MNICMNYHTTIHKNEPKLHTHKEMMNLTTDIILRRKKKKQGIKDQKQPKLYRLGLHI